jgi:hypothetical protein
MEIITQFQPLDQLLPGSWVEQFDQNLVAVVHDVNHQCAHLIAAEAPESLLRDLAVGCTPWTSGRQ